MKGKISFTMLIVLIISLFLILATGRKVPAKNGCSNANLRGSYGLHATGTTPGGPLAIVGVISYDGAGSLTGTLFARRTGSTTTEVIDLTGGTYTVHSDCTVSDTFGNSQHTSAIVEDGRGYFILNTTEGAPLVISGEARKHFPGNSE
jgi:hypothetical protein